MIKQFIRIISIILAVIIFPFSVPCIYASESDVLYDDIKYREELLDKVGVTVTGEETVTRGDFLMALLTALKLNTSEKEAPVFNDVTDTALMAVIPAAINIGIVSKADKFYPLDAITYPQAIKMVIEALGWGNEARYGGGFPTGYISVAHNIDLDDGIVSTDTFSKDAAVVLLSNMLLCRQVTFQQLRFVLLVSILRQ